MFIRADNIEYTRHAKNRMRWRKITKKEVESAIANPEKIENQGKRKDIYSKVDKKYLRVSGAFEGSKIVVISVVNKKE
ncbi:DUF4258 domain-containing protein [bacterium]|nr:MAG: DUF4258 domain-containing protein [bacterium]